MPLSESEFAEKLKRLEETGDALERNALALDLAETRDPRVFDALLRLIGRKGLENKRGTLVYCLENYNCAPARDLLLDLAETGNFEVAAQARFILDAQGLARDAGLRKTSEARQR